MRFRIGRTDRRRRRRELMPEVSWPPGESQHQRIQTDIVEAGGRVFSQRGYLQSDISGIALEAGLDTEAVRHHFPSTEGVLESLLATTGARALRYVAQLDRFCDSDSLKLYLAIAYDVELHARYPNHVKLYFMLPALRESPYGRFDTARKRLQHWYRKTISNGVESRAFRSLPESFVSILVNGVEEAALDTSPSAPTLGAAEQGFRVADFTLTGLLAQQEDVQGVRAEAMSQRGIETVDEETLAASSA